jgi:hypothetical protein
MRILSIRWPATGTIETVDALTGPSPQDNEIPRTTDYWPEGSEHYDYNTTSQRIINQDGLQTIGIHYSREDNSDWEFGWGTCTITISPDLNSATAEWMGDFDNRYNGWGHCTVFPKAPLNEREREELSRIKRRQDEFRLLLICRDHCCAITCEKTPDALDAAHIVAVADNGPDSLEYGILLRADIHRLWDRGLFEISYQDGTIEKISDSISEAYKSILKGKKLNEIIFARVQAALAERARLNQRRLAPSPPDTAAESL